MTRDPVVEYHGQRVLLDRQTLAALTGRSQHTIRLRCTVAVYRRGRALYDMTEVEAMLAATPPRRRRLGVA